MTSKLNITFMQLFLIFRSFWDF